MRQRTLGVALEVVFVPLLSRPAFGTGLTLDSGAGDWLEEQISEDEAQEAKVPQRKQRAKRKARDS